MPAADPIEPALKALLSEVAKMQDRHVNGLRQAVDVIASHSNTVDGLIQFMQTMAAHQEQLRADLNAHAQQLAATARSTQIP
jgi:ABC-type transporter Mla subunit MlaD